jgi:2-succinyl-6-hydroxy-2,4-cyclohexadiene-1-carboxylate synthase
VSRRVATGDLTLNVEVAGDGPSLLLLHGFTGSAAGWAPFVVQLSDRRTLAVDLIGHGASDKPADPERYRMERCVADLLCVLDTLGVEHTDVLSYSMGGRLALHFCAAAPERVGRLVLESASPGLATAEEREARIVADEALACFIEEQGLEAFVDRWESQPLFASQAALPAAVRAAVRAERLRNDPVGLANSLRGMGTGRQGPLWQQLHAITTPTLLLTGELDRKFCAIGREMAAAIPAARLTVVPGAGHAVHLEQPCAFARAVREFLDPAT